MISSDALPKLQELLDKFIAEKNVASTSENRNLDLPIFYNFSDLLSTYFDVAIREQETSSYPFGRIRINLENAYAVISRMICVFHSPLMMDATEDIEECPWSSLLLLFLVIIARYKYKSSDTDLYRIYKECDC